MTVPVFLCRMCGRCCEGEGGIVLAPEDMRRLCVSLALDEEVFMERYGVVRNGKITVRTGKDGRCVFFTAGEGCAVHGDKPDVCRAWPFFRGNMVDPESLRMAKDYCPGIHAEVGHAAFVEEGARYLRAHALEARDPSREAHALLSVAPRTRS